MQKISLVNKNLIIISFVSMLLVFWLGTTVWFDTYTQRGDAAQLKISTLPEETLFKLARSIALERSIINSILVDEKDDPGKIDLLYEIAGESSRMKNQAIQQIEETRNTESRFIHHRYSNEAIESLIVDLRDGFDRISQITSIVIVQLSVHPSDRDENIRMQLFDAYGNLIENVNNLRLRMHFLPARNYQHVIATHSLKDAVWDISESVSQIGSLLNSYLIKQETGTLDNMNREGLLFRIYQQAQRSENSLFEIKEYSASNDAADQLESKFNEIMSLYSGSYESIGKQIQNAVSVSSASTVSSTEWRQVSDEFQRAIRELSDDTIQQTLVSAQKIERSTIVGLGLNTLLVLLCIVIALISIRMSKNIQHQATHDDLTKLPNRRFFTSFLQEAILNTNTETEQLYLMTIDLDQFKSVNDTLGHAIGDALLIEMARRINQCTDDYQFVARMGGDEFSLILNSNDYNEVLKLAEKIRTEVIKTFIVDGGPITVGASIGLSSYPRDAATANELQITSDFAMFHAKKEGRNNIQSYSREIATAFETRSALERDLANAIALNELELHYQPQFNLAKNSVDAVEALIRWNHTTRGNVSPVEFIPIAEDCGLMPEIGRWVLDEACRQASVWDNETDMGLRIAINVSVQQLMQPGFVQDVFDSVEKHNITADHLEIEITENVFMADVNWITDCLLRLKNAGFKIALDDFGTGFSSLSILQDLPLNTLKIDRSFISKLTGDTGVSHSVTATIARMADVMGLETVAEGVESSEQITSVADLGIDVIQGYYYSKPVSGADLPAAVDCVNSNAMQSKAA